MTVEMVAVTACTFEEFKRLMDLSVRRSLHSSFMTTEWHGTTYRASAPGVAALGSYRDGEVRVTITISFPATMMQSFIVADIQRTMRDAGCTGVRPV